MEKVIRKATPKQTFSEWPKRVYFKNGTSTVVSSHAELNTLVGWAEKPFNRPAPVIKPRSVTMPEIDKLAQETLASVAAEAASHSDTASVSVPADGAAPATAPAGTGKGKKKAAAPK